MKLLHWRGERERKPEGDDEREGERIDDEDGCTSRSTSALRHVGSCNLPVYGRNVPVSRLALAQAEVVGFSGERAAVLRPTLRTNGIALSGYLAICLSGYQEGWLRLRNANKVLLVLMGKMPLLRLPTFNVYSPLLGVREPERLLA